MQQSESLLRLKAAAYNVSTAGMCITDENGIYVSVNEKYASLFGYAVDELIGTTFERLVRKTEFQKTNKIYENAIKSAGFESLAIGTRVKKNGHAVHVASEHRTFEEDGKIYMLTVVTDMTKQKELEKRQKLQEQMLIQQSKMAAMGEMISAIAHQWRQPLNALAIMVQDIKMAKHYGEMTDEYVGNMVSNAMNQIKFMSKTIDDFRNFFKPNKQKESFTLVSAALDVVSLVNSQMKHLGITVNVYSPLDIEGEDPGEIFIYGYQNELKQVILNLLSNSKDAILEKREKNKVDFAGEINVKVGLKKENGKKCAYLKVSDNGMGMGSDTISRVFEPYFTTKDQGKGTGIGLYMTKMIVEQNMHGVITASNAKDGGAVFEIVFDDII
jgi:PAS domain S-box-containing protein